MQQDQTDLSDDDLSFDSESISGSDESDFEVDDMNDSFSDNLDSALQGTPVLLQTDNDFPGLDLSVYHEASPSDSSCESLYKRMTYFTCVLNSLNQHLYSQSRILLKSTILLLQVRVFQPLRQPILQIILQVYHQLVLFFHLSQLV